MVQVGLLTAYPGGVHGVGWTPGGGSSFRQGARAASPGSPDLETAVASVQRGDREKDFDIRGLLRRGKYRPKEGPGGHQGARRVPGAPYPSAAPPGRLEPWW